MKRPSTSSGSPPMRIGVAARIFRKGEGQQAEENLRIGIDGGTKMRDHS